MELGMKRLIHRAHMEALQGRRFLDGTGIVHWWMKDNYAESMLIGLRRILDTTKGSFSLVRLLRKLMRSHALFTFEGYLEHWSGAQDPDDDLYARMLYASFS